MYLHDAMVFVLSQRQDRAATTSELSEEIARRELYARRKDGEAARAKQINARARQYPQLFELDSSGLVRLRSNSLTT